jgi:hypothetical protein
MKHFGPVGHIAIVSKTNLHALQHSDPKTQSEGGQSHGRMQNIFTTSKAVPRNSLLNGALTGLTNGITTSRADSNGRIVLLDRAPTSHF